MERFVSHFIYLLRTRESIRLGEDVYKLGKTRHGVKRLKGYPKGSELIMMTQVPDCDAMEKTLLAEFAVLYKQRTDMGVEYFEGDPLSMLGLLYERLQRVHWPAPQATIPEPTARAIEFSFEGYTGSAKPTPMATFLKPQKLRYELELLELGGVAKATARAAIATAHQEAINRHIQACFYESPPKCTLETRVRYGSTKKATKRAPPPAYGLVLRLGSSVKVPLSLIGHSDTYDTMKKAELVELAKKRKIKSASKLTVAQLRACLRGY